MCSQCEFTVYDFQAMCLLAEQNCFSLWRPICLQAIYYWDSYPWERGAELRNVQVGHQGNSETIGEHQEGGYCIHYHSVRHGTANECKDDVWGHTGEGHTDRQTSNVLPLTMWTCISNMMFRFRLKNKKRQDLLAKEGTPLWSTVGLFTGWGQFEKYHWKYCQRRLVCQ